MLLRHIKFGVGEKFYGMNKVTFAGLIMKIFDIICKLERDSDRTIKKVLCSQITRILC